jgi:hypothetical protein
MAYTYLAVAPCNFKLNGEKFSLKAGDSVIFSEAQADQVKEKSFLFNNHLRLISKIEEEENEKTVKVEKATSATSKNVISELTTEPNSVKKAEEVKVDSLEIKKEEKSNRFKKTIQ